jgi:hypothetical protein
MPPVLVRLLANLSAPAPPRAVVRTLYVRGLGLVSATAFGSWLLQHQALIGPQGLSPLSPWLAAVARKYGHGAYLEAPTLLWLAPEWTGAPAWLGLLVSALLVVGVPLEGPLLLAAWALYLTIAVAGQRFLQFQWDTLLLESLLCASFVARWNPRRNTQPRAFAWWAQWWLFFRLCFFAGWVKLASGDPTWRDLTALDYHFWTQPLPNPLSRWFHHLPGWVHAAGVAATFAVELVLPFGILLGRWPRLVLAAAFTGLMGSLAVSGNYGFFQLLSVVLVLPLLDDGFLPARWVARLAPTEGTGGWWAAPPAAVWALLGGLAALRDHRPEWGTALLSAVSPFRSTNSYGLFANMTEDRDEVLLEGTWDGVTWRELHLRAKPGPVDRIPPQVAPGMPRVDWQLWFAALSTCERNPWVRDLMQRVADGAPPVLDLFVDGTFADGPPLAVRATRWRYTFAPPGAATVWERTPKGAYCTGTTRRR